MAIEQLETVLKGIGMSEERVAELKAITEEGAKDFKPDTYLEEVNTTIRGKLSNDNDFLKSIPVDKLPEDFRKAIEAGQYGRFMGEARDLFQKQFGVDITKFTPEEQKSLKGLLTKAVNAYGESVSKGDASVQELQTKLQAAIAEKEEIVTKSTEQLTTKEKEVSGRYASKLSTLVAANVLSSVEGLTASVEMVLPGVLQKLSADYALVLNEETLSLELRQKVNDKLDATDDKGKKITLKDAMTKILTDNKMIAEKKKETEEEIEKKKITVEGDDTKISSHIQDKINANLKAEEKAAK